jgi:hypothetical protein
MDLWMTGATGKDIAEALYLEQRERWKIDLVIVLAVFLFSGALALFLIRPIATWGDYLILTLNIVYFMMAPLRAVLKGSAHGRAEIQRRFRMRRQTRTNLRKDTETPAIEPEMPQEKREVSKKERVSRRLNFSWILGGFALILVLNVVLLWGLRGFADRMVLYFIFLLIGFANNFYAWVWLPITEPRYSRLLFQQADRAFTLTMVTAMTEDPDGPRWFEQFIQPKRGNAPSTGL